MSRLRLTPEIVQVRAPSPEPLGLLPLYLCAGLTAGICEALILVALKLAFARVFYRSPDFFWVAPLTYLCVLAVPAMALAVLGRIRPSFKSESFRVFVLAACGGFLALRNVPHVAEWATVLSIGAAWQISQLASRYRNVFRTIVRVAVGWPAWLLPRRSAQTRHVNAKDAVASLTLPTRRDFLLGTGATVAGLAVGVRAWPEIFGRQLEANLPAAVGSLPNVLLVVLDTVRASSLGMYGYARPTSPNLDAFARRGVCFARAISTAPWTLASHAGMFTGHLPSELGIGVTRPMDNRFPTVAEALARHGYETVGFADNTIYGTREFGLSRGFVQYRDYPLSIGNFALSSTLGIDLFYTDPPVQQLLGAHQVTARRGAQELTSEFLDWHAERPARPYFAFINYFDAHDPYMPPADFALRFSSHIPSAWFDASKVDELTPAQISDLNDAYDASIAYADYHVGQLLAELERRETLDNTLVILVGDHGEQFGEHGLMYHGNSLYLPTLHVPLIIAAPARIPAGRVISRPTSLRNLPATIFDVLGLKPEAGFPGSSLSAYWSADSDTANPASEFIISEMEKVVNFPEHYPAERGNLQSVVADNLHFIKNLGDHGEELYDLSVDPSEQQNLAASDAGRRTIERLSLALERTTRG